MFIKQFRARIFCVYKCIGARNFVCCLIAEGNK